MDKKYKTNDMYLATLLNMTIPMSDIEGEGNRKTFVFSYTPELNDIVNQYFSGELLVEPKKLFYSLKEIKTRMYNL